MDIEKLRVGCSGWSYKDWSGPFYPKDLPARDYLKFYSKVFDCVEIDSSFYRIPSQAMVQQWGKVAPEGFSFSPKLTRKITHELKLQNSESTLLYFYSVFSKLKDKLGPINIQLPPSVKLKTHLETMKKFLALLRPEFRHAIEFRHKSWFTDEVYELLRENNVAMTWALNLYLETPPIVTSDFVYVRLVGDREIEKFDRVQRDRSVDTKHWAEVVKENSSKFESGYVFFNNHFAGFSPESNNEFRRLLGMIEADWRPGDTEQQTLLG